MRPTSVSFSLTGSGHPSPPTADYITSAIDIAHTATLAGRADGVITYLLGATPSLWPSVSERYAQWSSVAY
jgi:hypothetical protein